MTCSLCGGVCRCTPDARSAAGPRFQPGFESSSEAAGPLLRAQSVLIDPEAAGRTEEEFAASLDSRTGPSRPKFVVEQSDQRVADAVLPGDNGPSVEQSSFSQQPGSPQVQPNLLPEGDVASWRREVSERLHRYHSRRRPRAPRYPSLRLKFEVPETTWAASPRETAVSTQSAQSLPMRSPVTQQAVAMDYVELAPDTEARAFESRAGEAVSQVQEPRANEATAKIIEFPRSMYAQPTRLDDLAEPVFDRPRILEAPEVLPPPPALGGMTIEQAERAEPERRPGIDMPLQSAPPGQRLLATVIDATLVLVATALFGGVFCRIAAATPTAQQVAALAAGWLSVSWVAYQYLLIVHSGTTPGLRALKLRVQRFDGNPAGRRLRRARVLCSILSAASLGMGYAWHFLDEDGLCWHERVTKTHIASEKQA
jgi:uncharacterized RDD family membrane protein YckC